MKSRDDIASKINDCIQNRLSYKKNVNEVDSITATKWLIEENIREKLETRPGSYLRTFCRQGKILGAEKRNKRWIIKRVET
jgi:hypothetical protein